MKRPAKRSRFPRGTTTSRISSCASKKDVSAFQLSRTLEITYKSALFLAHRIRKAMEKEPVRSKLTGTVEADETYVDGKGTGIQGGPMAGG